MKSHLFGTDGIRGKAGQYPITPELAFQAGIAFAKHHAGKRVLLAMDTRESSPALAGALHAGLSAAGCAPIHGGILPTPVLAYAVASMDFSGGVMITASHNPYTDNGIKFFASDGRKISPETESLMESEILCQASPEKISKNNFHADSAPDPTSEDLFRNYTEHILSVIPLENIVTRIPLDCANGAGTALLHFVNQSLKTPFILRHTAPDGQNINRDCGAALPEKMGSDSAALDGDGDRILFKDARSRLITGDHILLFLSEFLGIKAIVGTVMTNQAVAEFSEKHGIAFYRSDVGDRFVRLLMDRHQATLGGETSGHIILDSLNVTGDGFAVFLQVLSLLSRENLTLSDIYNRYPMRPQTLVDIAVQDKPPLNKIPGFADLLSQLKEALGKSGRIFPRYSGTENLLRILIESSSEEQNEEIASKIAGFFKNRRTQ